MPCHGRPPFKNKKTEPGHARSVRRPERFPGTTAALPTTGTVRRRAPGVTPSVAPGPPGGPDALSRAASGAGSMGLRVSPHACRRAACSFGAGRAGLSPARHPPSMPFSSAFRRAEPFLARRTGAPAPPRMGAGPGLHTTGMVAHFRKNASAPGVKSNAESKGGGRWSLRSAFTSGSSID
ncbi:MAG: hypothetical protein HSCHL_2295 [Hydrogenibacillus schlegelii]|uniref:Uncharacterized protein n=1 Tax=Hydrogenibacillus schlegelii TaxID=1484 RepID=A0A2T5GET6_HYDSH|nr:MAG: hypothetical protein HSCHL_2295 [Hydrogenibacillus schlegelii]